MSYKIPASNWVLSKVYFEVKLVDNFSLLYKEWYKKENGSVDDSVDDFIHNLKEHPTIEIYRFPNERADLKYDFFEKDDDNHVIPRELFELV